MKILIADDEAAWLEALHAFLSQELPGHQILAAPSGPAALQSIENHAGVDLLITDVVMDPMDGFTLANTVQTTHPQTQVLFISGYDLSEHGTSLAGRPLLTKPFQFEDFQQAIERQIPGLFSSATPQAQSPEPVAAATPAATPVAVAAAAPAAKPVAVAAAAPAAKPVAVAAAAPAAKPVAVAAATPAATPVAVAAAAPAAKPVAVAAATPTATPVAVAAAAPAAKPVAVAAAAPAAKPVAVAAAAPAAKPVAVAAAAPAAKPVAASAAAPAAKPVAASAATPAAKPAAVAAAKPAAPLPQLSTDGTERINSTFGGFQINTLLAPERWGHVYKAIQISINRPVALCILDAKLAEDSAQKARFIAQARAKANVQHPAVLAVYEAGEVDGQHFCAHEFIEHQTLAECARSGRRLSEAAALKVLRSVAEGMAYLQDHNIVHAPLAAGSVLLGSDGQPRLANLATDIAEDKRTPAQEIQLLGQIISGLLEPAASAAAGLRALLGRISKPGAAGIPAWAALIQALKAREPKIVPKNAAEMSAQETSTIEHQAKLAKQQRRSFLISIGTVAAMSLATIGAGLKFFVFKGGDEQLDGDQIEIPAGTYIIGDKQKHKLGNPFWIDKYEVTIGQYAKFLDYLEKNPTADADLNHPRQPRSLSHEPKDWSLYYKRAARKLPVHGVPSSLNSPMLMVTWWDAYAYAKWKGRELPTAEEWEIAGRGAEGYIYPWGNEWEEDKANTNADYNARDPAAKATVDGFNFWGDVNRIKSDSSPFGVIGLAGNVSEWVAWPQDASAPLLKGGNFQADKNAARLDKQIADRKADDAQEFIGFRTISRTPPAADK